MLNRGGLLIPSSGVCSYSIKCFAILDVIHYVLIKHVPNNIKNSAEHLLSEYSPLTEFCCPVHNSSGCQVGVELSPIYILIMNKISQMQKFERMISKNLKHARLKKDECTVVKRLVGCCSSYVPVCF